jgi:hypothetical protein
MTQKNKVVYEESQSFFTWWLCLLLVFVLGAGIYTGWNGANADKQFDFLTGGSWGLIVSVLICSLIFFVRLRTRIDENGVHIRFFPLVWKEKTWRWDDIADVYVKRYSPWEYGGWGYRLSGAGRAYSTKGNYGIQLLVKKNAQRILIGTQRPEEVQILLERYYTKEV